MNKQETKTEIAALIATEPRTCAGAGRELERLVRRLQFWKAGPYTPRGIGDAALSDKTLVAMMEFRLRYEFYGELCDYLAE